MASVVKLHCIWHLHSTPTRRQQGMPTTTTALSPQIRIVQGLCRPSSSSRRAAQFRQSNCSQCGQQRQQDHRPQLSPVRVFAAKGNVRHRQKKSNSAPPLLTSQNNNVGFPPSAPSLTDLPLSQLEQEEDKEEEEEAPPVVDVAIRRSKSGIDGEDVEARNRSAPGSAGVLSWDLFPQLGRQILRRLSSLRLAIAELIVIAGLSALGTIIEQNESPKFYFDSYPEENPLFGFLTWRVIFGASLDHIYSSWYYLGLLFLLASSLVACSTTRQFPIVKVARSRPFFNWWGRMKDVVRRVKLRYGVHKSKKEGAKNAEVGKFKHLWNEIIGIFREEDIIGDDEVELLEMPSTGWNISVTQWPSILLSNELLIALGYCDPQHHWYHSDHWLWRKIASNEYRRCAVIESYESIKHVLSRIILGNSGDRYIFPVIFKEIDDAIHQERFLKTFKLKVLPDIHARLMKLITILLKRPLSKDIPKVVAALQDLCEVLMRDFPKDKNTKIKFRDLASKSGSLLFIDAVELPDAEEDGRFFYQLKRLATTLSTKVAFNNVPRNLEARRWMSFFSNSLFMTMPRAPQVDKVLAFSVLTPYYNEDVLHNRKSLSVENEDDDWEFFEERMVRRGIISEELRLAGRSMMEERLAVMWKVDDGLELRLWASYPTTLPCNFIWKICR